LEEAAMIGVKQIATHASFFSLRATPFGPMAAVWSPGGGAPRVRRIVLSKPGSPAGRVVAESFPEAAASSCAEIDGLMDRMEGFLNGEDVRFSLDAVFIDLCSPFQQGVLRAEHAIPRGRVSTYRLIARHLGHPKAARAVGTALATNPFPIVVPCHRAIRSDGHLGGYQGGTEMKRTLLAMEGVAFRDPEHVAAVAFFYGGE